MNNKTFRDLVSALKLDLTDVAEILDVHPVTVRKYHYDMKTVPLAYIRLLTLMKIRKVSLQRVLAIVEEDMADVADA